uniref:Cation efflux family protein n=1 Tax=Arundo donax TaxID=35708 RepID=A0A0A8ZIU2_ARUDO
MASIRDQPQTITHEPTAKLHKHVSCIDQQKRSNLPRLPLTHDMADWPHDCIVHRLRDISIPKIHIPSRGQLPASDPQEQPTDHETRQRHLGVVNQLENKSAYERHRKIHAWPATATVVLLPSP